MSKNKYLFVGFFTFLLLVTMASQIAYAEEEDDDDVECEQEGEHEGENEGCDNNKIIINGGLGLFALAIIFGLIYFYKRRNLVSR